jgi:hypothetical protein
LGGVCGAGSKDEQQEKNYQAAGGEETVRNDGVHDRNYTFFRVFSQNSVRSVHAKVVIHPTLESVSYAPTLLLA